MPKDPHLLEAAYKLPEEMLNPEQQEEFERKKIEFLRDNCFYDRWDEDVCNEDIKPNYEYTEDACGNGFWPGACRWTVPCES